MKRTFIGIKISVSPDFRNQLMDINQQMIREKINWVDPNLFHITIHFIGKVPDELIQSIDTALQNIVPSFSTLKIKIARLGVFPNVRRAKVLWADLEYDEQLNELQQAVVQSMKQHNLQVEEREFTPHLTLGRIKYLNHPYRLKQLLEQYSDTVFDEQILESVTFFESRLDQKGPSYYPINVYRLGASTATPKS